MNENLIFKKIISIKKKNKKQKVYNFDVPNYQNYIANGFIVHNCENSKISQEIDYSIGSYFSVEDIIKIAKEKMVDAICMTYSEPIIYYEYLLDLADEAHKNNFKFLLKTSAYINQAPWKKICSSVDAINIDFKGSKKNYNEIVMVDEYIIYDRIEEALKSRINVEISIPIYNGISFAELSRLAKFLADRDKSTGIHILKVNPANKHINFPSTSSEDMEKAVKIFKKRFSNLFID